MPCRTCASAVCRCAARARPSGTPDHYVPTVSRSPGGIARRRKSVGMVDTFAATSLPMASPAFQIGNERQGIVRRRRAGSRGLRAALRPGSDGDSHTSTHGALGRARLPAIGQSETSTCRHQTLLAGAAERPCASPSMACAPPGTAPGRDPHDHRQDRVGGAVASSRIRWRRRSAP